MKKLISLLLAVSVLLGMAAFASAENESKTLYYPAALVDAEGETLVLDKTPERIVCLSNAALQVLVRSGVVPMAITSLNASANFPDWVRELPQITISMGSLDIEAVVAMEPDLVIVGEYQKESYGQQLADAGIPVYYTLEGPSISYEDTKDQARALALSFGDEALAEEIAAEFSAVEQRALDFAAAHEKQTMMIFFSAPGAYQQTSAGYLGGMLSFLPFENLSDALVGKDMPTAPIDVETCISLNPEVIFAISPMARTAEMLQEQFEEVFHSDPDLWNQMDAVRNGKVIYLSNEYVTTKGIQVIDSMNKLIDLLAETL